MTRRQATRRGLLAVAALVGACSQSGPEKAAALADIADRIRARFAPGEQRLENLVFKSSKDLGGGRSAVFVSYDLVATMPEIGLFNTVVKSGERSHVDGERYIFVRSSAGWTLEQAGTSPATRR